LQASDTNYLQQHVTSGGDVNRSIRYSRSVLRTAPLLDVAVEYGQLSAVDFLFKKGADPNRRDSAGFTPLSWAIGRIGNEVPHETELQIFKMLLKAGADPNSQVSKESGYTSLLDASSLGQSEMVSILLAAGVDVKATDSTGQSALHLAGNAKVARLLITAGADPEARTISGATPVDTAAEFAHSDVLAVLTNAHRGTNRNAKSIK